MSAYIHYDPEKFGLETVVTHDARDTDYWFDIFWVVRSIETGHVYVADDCGCSCPVPFEDHSFPQDFARVWTWEDVKREYDARFPESDYRSRNSLSVHRQKIVGAIRRGS